MVRRLYPCFDGNTCEAHSNCWMFVVLSFNGTSGGTIPVTFAALLFLLVLVLLVGVPFCIAPEKCCKALIKHHKVSHTIAVISSWASCFVYVCIPTKAQFVCKYMRMTYKIQNLNFLGSVAVALMAVCLGWWHNLSTRTEHAVSASRTTAEYKVDWLRSSTQELQAATRTLTHEMTFGNARAIIGMQRLRTKFVSVETGDLAHA